MQASLQCLRSASGLFRPRQAPVPTKSTGCAQLSLSCYTRMPAPTWSVGSGQQRCQRSQQHAAVSSPSAVSVDGSEEDMVCLPGSTTVDNEAHPNYTVVTMEGADYPGLLRVIAWVINGLGLIVHSAVLKSDADKQAADVFWVTDMKGRKLTDKFATGLAERLQDYVNYCQPAISGEEPQEYSCGNIEVSNAVHPKFTQVTITAEAHSPGLLLELASVITGQQVTICEAVIRSHGDNPIASSQTTLEQPSPPPGKRVLRFWVVESKSKDKLDFSSISALVYTMRLVLGHGRVSTLPPGSDITFGGCGCASEGNNRTPSAMSSFETS